MTTFEVYLNGEKVCIAGIANPGVLTAILTWASANRERPDLDLAVAGHEEAQDLRWLHRKVQTGDVIEIRVVEQPVCDEPEHRQAEDPQLLEKAQRNHYRRLKAKYGDE
jgi:hypothetical protein